MPVNITWSKWEDGRKAPSAVCSSCWTHWSAKEMRRIDELCQNPHRRKKIDDPAWAHLAITTAARKVSGVHALKIIRDNICTCFINVNKHAPTPLGIFLFLSPRSNAPQIGFDLDGSPGRREVSEPHRPTAGKFNAQSSQSYPVKYHFNRQGGKKHKLLLATSHFFDNIQAIRGLQAEWVTEWVTERVRRHKPPRGLRAAALETK